MGQTSAERQRAYRERRRDDADRLSVMLSAHAMACLRRLARHQGQTLRKVLEVLLIDAERRTTEHLPSNSAYFAPVTR